MPVYRLTASSMISSFRASGKRHLLLTGGRCVRWCHCFAPGHRKLPQQCTLRTVWKFEKVWAEK